MATSNTTSSSSDCATMMISGQRYPVHSSANVIALLRRGHGRARLGEGRAFTHDGGCARDRVGKIEVVDGRLERRLVDLSARHGKLPHVRGAARHHLADAGEMRMLVE